MMRSTIFPKVKQVCRKLFVLAFWLGVWQLAAMVVGQELLIPAPHLVLQRLVELGATALFWQSAAGTLLRIFIGFLLGVFLGSVVGVLTASLSVADLLLSPAVRVVRATPVASFIMLMLLWVQTGFLPALISALMVMPVLWGNVTRGIRETDPLLLEMGEIYGFGFWKQKRLIYLPSVLPYFTSGCKTALGLAWKSGVAAEVLCLPKQAVGTQVYYSKIYLETPSLFAWTVVVIVLSFFVEGVLVFGMNRLEHKWRRQKGGGAGAEG
jgi:NitT/TauT family transport system permease protein